jgi:hypothetical protein
MRRAIGCWVLTISILGNSLAWACSCAPPPPPKLAMEASSAVFSGKVVSIETEGEFEKAVTLEVGDVWKGVEAKKVTIYTAKDGAACGVDFKEGTKYLVYATLLKRGDSKGLSTNLCSRTKPLADAKEDIDALGKPTTAAVDAP